VACTAGATDPNVTAAAMTKMTARLRIVLAPVLAALPKIALLAAGRQRRDAAHFQLDGSPCVLREVASRLLNITAEPDSALAVIERLA
jgi:hypothetical protein